MDANEGRLPTGIAFILKEKTFTMPGYDPSNELPYPNFDRYHGIGIARGIMIALLATNSSDPPFEVFQQNL